MRDSTIRGVRYAGRSPARQPGDFHRQAPFRCLPSPSPSRRRWDRGLRRRRRRGDEDPQEVLDATFNNEEQIDSGVFDLSFDLTAEGGEGPGTLEASLGGPSRAAAAEVPQFDLNAEIDLETSSAQDFSGSAGLSPPATRPSSASRTPTTRCPRSFPRSSSTTFEQAPGAEPVSRATRATSSSLGIDPSNWLTDLSNEGNEDVEGTDTIHISGQADVPKLVEDMKEGSPENAPSPASGSPPAQLDQLDELTDIIKSATSTSSRAPTTTSCASSTQPRADAPGGHRRGTRLGHPRGLADDQRRQRAPDDLAPSGAQPLATLLQQFGIDPASSGAPPRWPRGRRRPAKVGRPRRRRSAAPRRPTCDCLQQAQGEAAVTECAPCWSSFRPRPRQANRPSPRPGDRH